MAAVGVAAAACCSVGVIALRRLLVLVRYHQSQPAASAGSLAGGCNVMPMGGMSTPPMMGGGRWPDGER